MSETFECPRRGEMLRPGNTSDTWRKPRGGPMGKYRSCSYCGSAHPDDFLQACRDGAKLGPTDKSYKVYLGETDGKFYFQHLSDAQRGEFVDLLNAKTVNIGYPGHFYVLPFFITQGGDR